MYSKYYTAKSLKSMTWFIFGVFRNEENVAFGRTLDKNESLLEFFVSPNYEAHFLKVANYLSQKGYLFELKEKVNRLK
ncbi:MAG: hypothetical protein SZ59_C0006G0014 [candidate division TM6 bacterium GW2011_GWF2_28_16]|jgi:hypothetical protein|nr:MAG: hypothetical protein SZ59_C0006G0014 [candidate division TM6 bacterium GW2011_GWF2_28_16]